MLFTILAGIVMVVIILWVSNRENKNSVIKAVGGKGCYSAEGYHAQIKHPVFFNNFKECNNSLK